MAEGAMSVTYQDLQQAVGDNLGYGRGAEAGEPEWTARQSNDIAFLVKQGLNQVYVTPPLPDGTPANYEWSFLRPVASMILDAGAGSVACPDDWNGAAEPVTVSPVDGRARGVPIPMCGPGEVAHARAVNPSRTGRPTMIAEAPLRGTDLLHGQRFEIVVFPLADVAYRLTVAYTLLPEVLSGSHPYVYGGAQHGSTFLASVLAAAELWKDNERGPRWQYFMERLMASIGADRRRKPRSLGYNGDTSDGGVGWQDDFPVVTIGGIVPE